jgi:hypothetical protein
MLCDDCNENGEHETSAAAVGLLTGQLLCSIPVMLMTAVSLHKNVLCFKEVSLILDNSLLEAIPGLAEKPGAMQPKLEQHSTLFSASSVLPR